MEHDFWHTKWEKRELGFHEGTPNQLLTKHFRKLELASRSRVFVPLCGKTRDISWLLDQGYKVVGAELNESAVQELFEEVDQAALVSSSGPIKHYAGLGIEVFVGDIFNLSQEMLGKVDAVYDRAALVALPPVLRAQYAQHLASLSETAPQLVITFSYEQSLMHGPPFSVPDQELLSHYGNRYHLHPLESRPLEGGLKGKVPALETVHYLEPR